MTGRQGRRPTIRDVAERAGVSMQTVSNVINDRPVTRPETRLRVEKAIGELGYERDALARALRLQQSQVLGFFIEDQSHLALQDPTHAALLTGMVEAARQREYAVTVLVAAPASTDRVVSTLRQQLRVAGVLLSLQGPEGERRDLFERQARIGMPTVIFEQHTDVPGVASVTSDNEGGAAQVARHLLGLGHRRLAMLTGATAWPGENVDSRAFWPRPRGPGSRSRCVARTRGVSKPHASRPGRCSPTNGRRRCSRRTTSSLSECC